MLLQALNEESQIRDCVRSLRELDPPAHEILVVDGGSNDRCAEAGILPCASALAGRRDAQGPGSTTSHDWVPACMRSMGPLAAAATHALT